MATPVGQQQSHLHSAAPSSPSPPPQPLSSAQEALSSLRSLFQRAIRGIQWVWSVVRQRGTLGTLATISATSQVVSYFSPKWGRRAEVWVLRLRVAWGDVQNSHTEQQLQERVRAQGELVTAQGGEISKLVVQTALHTRDKTDLTSRLEDQTRFATERADRLRVLTAETTSQKTQIQELQERLEKANRAREQAEGERDEVRRQLSGLLQGGSVESAHGISDSSEGGETAFRGAYERYARLHTESLPSLERAANSVASPSEQAALRKAIAAAKGLLALVQITLLPPDESGEGSTHV